METLMKQKGVDQNYCNIGLGIGTKTREEDQMYASQRNENGPPVHLDLFPLAPVLPHDSGRGTMPREKTSPGIDRGAGGQRSAGKEKVTMALPINLSLRSDAIKFPDSCYYNGEAGRAINVSSSSNNTVASSAINQEHGYAMDSKRKRGATNELQNDILWSRLLSDVDREEEGGAKKKLRLSRDQCVVLTESFRKNRAPEPNQKQALALQLNLLPRQVEVWFQNKRARTKLKQTEVDCELLKRCNESLVEENRKLQKEVEELRAMKWASPLTALCPSCPRVSPAHSSGPFTLAEARSIFLRGAFRQ